MAENSKIEWCDHTFNPWIGCTKVSPGCKNCYAELTTRARVLRHDGHETWGKGAMRSRTSDDNWKHPLKWNADPLIWDEKEGRHRRARVFCASTADWLDDEVPIHWFIDLLALIEKTPNLDWLLLTKRPENFFPRMSAMQSALDLCGGWVDGYAPENVWIGASAENQECFNTRYSHLSDIPARLRFWSMEPLLTSIDFTEIHYASSFKSYFHWVIVGGESGSKGKARHCHTDDIRDIVSQCNLHDVPCFVKQLGSNAVAAGRDQKNLIAMQHKKGGDISEWPEDLRVRQFPKSA